jgi:hypothetical protein
MGSHMKAQLTVEMSRRCGSFTLKTDTPGVYEALVNTYTNTQQQFLEDSNLLEYFGGRPRRIWKNNIKMDLWDIGCECVNWLSIGSVSWILWTWYVPDSNAVPQLVEA